MSHRTCPLYIHHIPIGLLETIKLKLTPLHELQTHTTLRPASSHHSTTSELTPLYDQRAHTTLRPASSHHSTTSELTPLYDQRAHTTLRPASSHRSKRAHTTLQPASSNHSMTSELTPLYNQRAHTTLRPASSHHSTNNEITPLSLHQIYTLPLSPLPPTTILHFLLCPSSPSFHLSLTLTLCIHTACIQVPMEIYLGQCSQAEAMQNCRINEHSLNNSPFSPPLHHSHYSIPHPLPFPPYPPLNIPSKAPP